MAFSAAVRRLASSTALPAIRSAIGRRSSRSHHSAPVLRHLHRISSQPLRPSAAAPSLARFSSAAKKPPSDAELLRIINDEIKCAEECDDHDRVEEKPDTCPFEIHDEKGTNVITLKRTFRDENIQVTVQMPSLVTGEEPGDDRAENDDGDDSEKASQSSLPLIVSVTKGDGPSLEFTCTAYADEVVIDSMSVTQVKGADEEEVFAYEGPDFNDLDENLQKAFHKYLEIRGISPLNTNFFHEYMINKDSREYLFWLNNLKQFVQK